ncbi:MAG: hypothetical protein IJT83_01920 [Victivallales bacterium]|nr:hypothetical protein [Victivallales bacterium]
MLSKRFVLFAVMCAAMLSPLAGGADKEEEFRPPYVSVQESKIENKTDVRNANFRGLIDRLKIALMEAGFAVKDEKDMGDAMVERGKAAVLDGMEGDKPIEGGLVVPGYWVRMNVLQYGFGEMVRVDPTSNVKKVTRYALVEVSFFIVDARKGSLVFSTMEKSEPAYISEVSSGMAGARGNFDQQALQTATDGCINKMIPKFITKVPRKFRPQPMTGTVLAVVKKDGRVIINLNMDKVKEGDLLDVYRLEALADDGDDDDDDDDDDDVLAEIQDEIYVGTLRVTEAKEKYSNCQVIALAKEDEKIKKKYIVKPSTHFKSVDVPTEPVRPQVVNPFGGAKPARKGNTVAPW